MFEHMALRPIRHRFADERAFVATVLSLAALFVVHLTTAAAAGGFSPRHAGKTGHANNDVDLMLQLALKSSRQQLALARRKCDAYAANAARDDVASVVALANCYKRGVGRPKSLMRAKRHFEVAARHGSTAAYLALGQFYRDGRIVPRNLRRTAAYFRKAAKANLPQAMIEYGLVWIRLRRDRQIACDWFERAANLGARDGMRLLADCHALGLGRRADQKRARELYQKAVLLGDRTALLKLTGHVFKGVGADIAAAEGCDWASEAAARDNQAASEAFAYCLSVIR